MISSKTHIIRLDNKKKLKKGIANTYLRWYYIQVIAG